MTAGGLQAAERMLNTELAMREFEQIVAQVWPVKDNASETTQRNAKQRLGTLKYLIREADTQKAIEGSRWAGYQAITVDKVEVEVGMGSPIPVEAVASGTWPDLCAQIAEVQGRWLRDRCDSPGKHHFTLPARSPRPAVSICFPAKRC